MMHECEIVCTSVSSPSSWPRAPETRVDSYVIRALETSFVLIRQLWMGSWMGAGPEKDGRMLKSLAFTAPAPFSREGNGAGNGANNRSCLHEEASIKSQQHWHQDATRLVSTSMYCESNAPNSMDLPRNCLRFPSSGCSFVSFIMNYYT